jgi:hypothetical protein
MALTSTRGTFWRFTASKASSVSTNGDRAF